MGKNAEHSDDVAALGDAARGHRRPRRRPGENRERLIEAGIHVFGANGYHGASTAAIAALADVPQPHVYASFSTKQELFLTCWERVYDEVLQKVGDVPTLTAAFFLQATSVVHSPDFAQTLVHGDLIELRTVLGSSRLQKLLKSGFDQLLTETRT